MSASPRCGSRCLRAIRDAALSLRLNLLRTQVQIGRDKPIKKAEPSSKDRLI